MAEYLKSWLQTRIHATRTLLLDITPRTPSQEIAHGRCIGRLGVLELGGGTDPLDTGAVCRDDIDAMEFKDFKALILNIEHETSAVYMQSTRTQEARKRQTPTWSTLPQPWTSLEEKLGNIEALLREMELRKEEARQREYAQRTRRLISEVKTNLLDIEARHGDDIETCELDALRASLDYATFNTNMIYMSPQTKKLDIFMYVLEDLSNRISVRIFATKRL